MPDDILKNIESAPKGGFGSELFWRVLATIIFVAVVWILWLLWQITPRSTFNPIVFQIQQGRQSASGTIDRAAIDGKSDDPAQAVERQNATQPSALSSGSPLENLKIETELKTPPQSSKANAK